MNPIKSEDELKTGYLKVQLDYAPIDDEEKFKLWCKKYNFDYVGLEGRGAWCSSLGTYFRGASGVAFNDGEMFLFYEDNLIDITDLQRQHEREIADNLIDQEGKLYKIYQDDEKIMVGIKIMADEVREYYDGGIYTKN